MLEWIQNNTKGKNIKVQAVDLIKNENITGKDLVKFKQLREFEQIGISSVMSRRIFEALEKAFPNEFPMSEQARKEEKAARTDARLDALLERNNQNLRLRNSTTKQNTTNNTYTNITTNNNMYNNKNNSNNNKFHVSIMVGTTRKKTRSLFSDTDKIYKLKEHIADTEIGGAAESVRIIYDGKYLQDNDTLGQVGIANSKRLVTVVLDVNGGAAPLPISDEKEREKETEDEKVSLKNINNNCDIRDRFPHFNENNRIKPSLEPDCVTYEDSQDELRVLMPCGHVFSPLTIFKWCQS